VGSLPILGGTAADNWTLERTYQYLDDEVYSDAAVAVLISGSGRIVHAIEHGCVAIGAERKITKAVDNVIWEIDGKPALDVMREYVDVETEEKWKKAIVSLAIGLRAPGRAGSSTDEYLIRFIPLKNDAEKWIMTQTAIAEGTSIWMTNRDYEKISEGIERVAKHMHASLEGATPSVIFKFDCTGRGHVTLRDEDRLRLADRLHKQVCATAPWIGFYCYGEIAPFHGTNSFHNYTVVLAALV
jgi:hypothetical protein